uniref:Potassium channel domain-containing protein n=1 Tax=Plectus sambesii TaxID=2011161 RepID=A0A914UN56_9BILA
MSSLFLQPLTKLRQVWDDSRTGKVVLVLVIYSFAGAGLFYLIENRLADLSAVNDARCLVNYDYWGCLHYVNTLYTTVGYGNVYCCTTVGRIVSGVYIFFGVPMMLVVLEALGKTMARLATIIWFGLVSSAENLKDTIKAAFKKERQRRQSVTPVVQVWTTATLYKKAFKKRLDSSYYNQTQVLPLYAALIITLAWILLVGAYFSFMEGWAYGDSVYFLWITMTTVGLGDFAPTRFEYTIINFAFLIIGLSFVSMMIAIVRLKIENMIKRMQRQIAEKLSQELTVGDNPEKIAELRKELGLLGAAEERLIQALMPEGHLKQMTEDVVESSRMLSKSTQFPEEEVEENDARLSAYKERPAWKSYFPPKDYIGDVEYLPP